MTQRCRFVLSPRAALAAVLVAAPASGSGLCVEPDNGNGTADLPASCPYTAPNVGMMIINGLPAGTTIEIDPSLGQFANVVRAPGGIFGPQGEIQSFDAVLTMAMTGTGELNVFIRLIQLPVSGEFHTAPRTPGDPVQSFDAEIFALHGELFGDPDFDVLSLQAGPDFGLPSPGQTTLTRVGDPGSDFAVDSFFDVEYRITFAGEPGSLIEDYSGVTQEHVFLRQGKPVGCPWDCGNFDNVVGVDDFLAVLAQWAQIGTSCDLGLGAAGVGVDEFLEVLAHWGPCGGLHPACFPGEGNCFAENGSPACDIVFCCTSVCDIDPFCCDVDWDADCVTLAGQLCAVSGAP